MRRNTTVKVTVDPDGCLRFLIAFWVVIIVLVALALFIDAVELVAGWVAS